MASRKRKKDVVLELIPDARPMNGDPAEGLGNLNVQIINKGGKGFQLNGDEGCWVQADLFGEDFDGKA